MDLVNDPRFFQGSVIEKRLAAFGGLSVIGSFLLTSSMTQLYALKKDMIFSASLDGIFACVQLAGFVVMTCVAYSLAVGTFVQVHQIFFTYRLLTAGPTGFEQASMFYLNRTIVMWRHFAMKMMMNGMIFYMVGSGAILCTKFYKDAEAKNKSADLGQLSLVVPVQRGWTLDKKFAAAQLGLQTEGHVDMFVHTLMAGLIFVAFLLFGCHLALIRRQHLDCFQQHYHFAHELQTHLTAPSRSMQTGRSGAFIET